MPFTQGFLPASSALPGTLFLLPGNAEDVRLRRR